MISKRLIETMVEMFPVGGDDPTRFTIMGVRLVSARGKQTLVATNGHMLAKRETSLQCPDGTFQLHKAALPAVKLVLKAFKNMDTIDCSVVPAGLLIGCGSECTATIEKPTHDYPDYEQVIPKNVQNCTSIAFNAEYLLALAKALTDGDKRQLRDPSVRIEFDATNPHNPIRVFGPAGEALGVLMPRREPGTVAVTSALADRLKSALKEAS